MFLGHENVAIVIAKHDEKILLQLLMEVNKLMFERVKETFNFHSEGDYKGLFHPTSTTMDIFKDIVSKEVVRFWRFPIDVESNKCALYGGTKKNTSFEPLPF